MDKITGFEKIRKQVREELRKGKDMLLFAFNATGKTRLSCSFENNEHIETLSYNAIVEDYFSWDNEDFTMVLKDSWLFNFIVDEGLENNIALTFDKFTDERIEPIIDFKSGKIRFQMCDENDERKFIKISKGEETLFKWSVFYVALKQVIDILRDKKENRSTDEFDKLKYVIIDDPMSSLDEFKIYTLSMQILDLLTYAHEKGIKISFLLSTHHVMFYNILFNTLRNRNKDKKEKCIFAIMQKDGKEIVVYNLNGKNSITYHLKMLNEIKMAFEFNTVKKNHYNMFRSVLEKSSIFLGYSNWQDMFDGYENKASLNKIVNMNSHEQYVELETEYLTKEQIDEFKNGFDYFIKTYKIKLGD